jgi:hypothetical protein
MKPIILALLFALSLTILNAQPPAKQLKKVLELKIPREGGANGASVAWHPVFKKYYAAMAGNVSYCLGVFDATGKLLSPSELNTKFDIRGLWYNPVAKTLQMNGYNDFGWGEYRLNSKGFPDTVEVLHEGMNQPDEQSVGAFDPQKKWVYFFNEEGNLDVYDLKDGKYQDNIELSLGRTKKDDEETDAALAGNYDAIDDYNRSSIVFTGIPGAEIGLLNHLESRVELYNLKDGHLTRKIALPADAPVNNFLNFSYCNGTWWLFDKQARIWKGYR